MAVDEASVAPAVAAVLEKLETLLAVRSGLVFDLERIGAGGSAAPDIDAEVARLISCADRLAVDIERLIARLEALLPPENSAQPRC